jgi:hypothetical protein
MIEAPGASRLNIIFLVETDCPLPQSHARRLLNLNRYPVTPQNDALAEREDGLLQSVTSSRKIAS